MLAFPLRLIFPSSLRVTAGHHRLAVEEALHLVAAVALEEAHLRVGLDALGDHLEVQRCGRAR